MDNLINTWQQGEFIDQRKYSHMGQVWKDGQALKEKTLVRPAPMGNAICQCNDPLSAKWIAQRLNLASILEQMTYDYATGKTDGQELVDLVMKNVNS